ncbi:hypothetical protein O4H52_03030 [Sphingomonadaceae bacterium G21617-S1]|nr:hypothetical protein [Sphingomonadaceae bacterium G21617-S1]
MAETGGIPPGEVGGWIAIVGAIVAIFGGPRAVAKAVEWLDGRAERKRVSRETKLQSWQNENAAKEATLAAREAQLDQKVADNLAKCEEHCAKVTARADTLFYVFVLILPEVERFAPESPLLRKAKSLLANVLPIPIDPTLPPDMKAQLAAIDEKTSSEAL